MDYFRQSVFAVLPPKIKGHKFKFAFDYHCFW